MTQMEFGVLFDYVIAVGLLKIKQNPICKTVEEMKKLDVAMKKRSKYNKEIKNRWEIAKYYREKISPQTCALPVKNIEFIRKKVINRVKS